MKLAILQLGLLIWKCWKTESRKKIRLICEIVFPLFMFVIVVAVRNSLSNLRKSQTECHFNAKPLLSAGVVPFLQGILCNANNTCHEQKTLGEDTRYPFNKTIMSQLQNSAISDSSSLDDTTDDSLSPILSSVSLLWQSFCDEPFPIDSEHQDSSEANTENRQRGSSSVLGAFSPEKCLRQYSPRRFTNVSGDATASNSTTFTAFMQCRQFICILRSVPPLWMTISRILIGKVVYYPNTTVVNKLMLRVENGLDWARVLHEAVDLAQIRFQAFAGRDQNTNEAGSRMDQLIKILGCLSVVTNRFEGVDSVDTLMEKSLRYSTRNRLTASIHFYDADKLQGDQLPSVVRYAIRMNPSHLDKTTAVKDRPFNLRVRHNPMRDMPYFLTGFIYLQDVIDKSIIRMQVQQQEDVDPGSTNPMFAELGTIMQQFPYPCYLDDIFLQVLANQLTMYIVLGWIFLAAIIVKSIVLEKERKLREVARIMGISPGLHFLSWFIFWALMMLATTLIFVIIVMVGKVFVYSSAGVIFILMITYSFATISCCFFVSSFFNRANVAAVVSGLVYFLTYIAYGGIANSNTDSLNLLKMMLSSVIPNVALGFGWQVIANYELTTEGASFTKFNVPISDEPTDQYTLAHAIAMLLFDTWFYYFLAWYIDYVFPGEFGVPLPWYFVFQPSFWCSSSCHSQYHMRFGITGNGKIEELFARNIGNDKDFELEPHHLPVGCAIKSVVKIYNFGIFQRLRRFITRDENRRAVRAAVDRLSLNLYEGQITALLGHNGAGKTTAMSIITGLIPATSGSVSIYGHDVASELSTVRRMMGFCPQFNVLYDELTVSEHMWFYAKIRGHNNERIRADTEQMLKDTNLTFKQNERTKLLSGGMRRRLSIAVAFIGNAKCVVLDEPTAGVDPYARRSIWDLLSKFRANRTIILSTHHMDEAELLADRIAIVSNGRLQTCGSPLFLKEAHGEGYRLTVVRDKNAYLEKLARNNDEAGSELTECESTVEKPAAVLDSARLSVIDCQHENAISEFVGRNLAPASCRLIGNSGVEIRYLLGYDGVERFSDFFKLLDQSMSELCISTYGLSDTTLEEIFIKIAHIADAVEEREQFPASGREQPQNELSTPGSYETDSGIHLISLQFYGLLVKRYHRMRRSWKGFIVELLLPVVFVLLGVAVIKLAEFKPDNPPPLELAPWLLSPGPASAHDQRLYSFFSAISSENDVVQLNDEMSTASASSDYAGTRCMHPSAGYTISKYPCSTYMTNDSDWLTADRKFQQKNCHCTDEGIQQCLAENERNDVLYKHLKTTDYLLNLTGFDVSSYITNNYKSLKHNFYGGWSFIVSIPLVDLLLSNAVSRSTHPFLPKLVSPGSIMVWFNNKGWMSSVAYNNYINNLLLRLAMSKDVNAPNSSFGIVTFNHPLNYTGDQLWDRLQTAAFIDVMLAIMLILALSFVPASFVMFLIEDRVSHSKHVQIVSGLRPAIYWLANYAWDCINYLLPVTACLCIFAAFQVEAYIDESSISALVLLFILYGFALAPMLYPTSLYFSTPSTAFVILACASLIIGSGTTIATWFLDLLYLRERDENLQNVNEFLKVFFFIFPQYCFGRGLVNLAVSYRTAQGKSFFTGSAIKNHKPLEWNICGRFLFALFLHSIAWLCINLILAYYLSHLQNKATEARVVVQNIVRKITRVCCRRGVVKNASVNQPQRGDNPATSEDADVAAEQQNILANNYGPSEFLLMVKQLEKSFVTTRGQLVAVNKLTFGVPSGQCFGLLGMNGAGKSTTFNMLTGLLSPSSGTATIREYDILASRNNANKLIGYCPQYDCITPLLSGRENLEFFARLRGIPEKHVKKIASFNLRRLDLLDHANKPAAAYSGGNKRKLSVAIAFSGEPLLILLDEPTAGIDPRARRYLWKAVQALLHQGQSVILTTHSMDECEALCTRLAIMVNGQFRCLGSPQHLKARFGEGYLLTLRFSKNNNTPVWPRLFDMALQKLQLQFSDVSLKEKHDTTAVFSIGASSREQVKLDRLFAFLTDNETLSTLCISDYSLMQSSLDSVFVTFAKMQRYDQLGEQETRGNNENSNCTTTTNNNNGTVSSF